MVALQAIHQSSNLCGSTLKTLWPSGKALVCKTSIPSSNLGRVTCRVIAKVASQAHNLEVESSSLSPATMFKIGREMEEVKENLEEKITPYNALIIMNNLLWATTKVKSLRRAFKRGRLTGGGSLKPHRPFNNRANTSKRKGVESRFMNTVKKRMYECIKRRLAEQSV